MGAMEEPKGPPAAITRVYERHACLYIEGKVLTPKGWLDAKFTVFKPDIEGYTRQQFEDFALRNLPLVTVDKQWDEKGQLVA